MSSLLVTLSKEDLSKSSEPVTPPRSLQRYPSKDDAQVDIELGPARPASLQDTPAQPTSSAEPPNNETDMVQTIWKPFKNRFRVLACCIGAFTQGMNDSAPGAIIASIENHYHITYGTVAIIFVCNALGYIVAAFFISSLSSSIGRAKTLVIAQILLILAYLTIVLTPSFAAVCAAFFVTGVGLATNLAIGQVFCANLASNTAILGAFQGAYGIGGIVAPLTATQLVSRSVLWSRFYFIELGLACFNLGSFAWTFWNYEQESSESEISKPGHTRPAPRDQDSKVVNRSAKRWQSFKTLLSDRPTILGALFIFAYQGAEVAISGWVISFLVQFRHGDPSKVGFVTSGFWAGITIGRFTLSFLAHRIGERRFVFIVTAGALILELLIWFVPSIPGDSVAIAFSGLLLGPVYPCAVHTFQQLIPRKMQISSLSLIGSVGSSGGAVAPFMVGMIAQRAGTFVLHPICIGLFVLMSATWWALPKAERKQA